MFNAIHSCPPKSSRAASKRSRTNDTEDDENLTTMWVVVLLAFTNTHIYTFNPTERVPMGHFGTFLIWQQCKIVAFMLIWSMFARSRCVCVCVWVGVDLYMFHPNQSHGRTPPVCCGQWTSFRLQTETLYVEDPDSKWCLTTSVTTFSLCCLSGCDDVQC